MEKLLLKELWQKSWSRCYILSGGDETWKLLESVYNQKGRYYHNLCHVRNCLKWLELYKHEAAILEQWQYLAVEIALWFHDAVYDPQRNDNEEKSSQLFLEIADSLMIDVGLKERISHLILLTKGRAIAASTDEQLMLDCDLSILGAPAAEYDVYAINIRREYIFVEERVYREKRSQILQQFLERSHIFQLPFFREKLEERARINVRHEIERLAIASF